MSWRIIIAAGLAGLRAQARRAWTGRPGRCRRRRRARSILAGACPAIRLSRRCRYSTTARNLAAFRSRGPAAGHPGRGRRGRAPAAPYAPRALRGAARRLARTALPGRRPEGHGAAQSGAGRQRPGGTPLPPTLYIIKDSPKFRVVHDEILRDSPAVPAILQVQGTYHRSFVVARATTRPCSSPTRAWSSSRMCSRQGDALVFARDVVAA